MTSNLPKRCGVIGGGRMGAGIAGLNIVLTVGGSVIGMITGS